MYAFIDAHHASYGVEPICRVLAIAQSRDLLHRRRLVDASQRLARAPRDAELLEAILRVYRANHEVYGPQKA